MCEEAVAVSSGEWVEILEPKTRVQMFANLITGECRWDEPRGQGVVISRATNPRFTQWWELYDNNSQRFYYYCAKDSKTVWRRPTTPDAIVVPLAKLQILKQNTTSGASPPVVMRSSSVSTQTEPQLCSRATQTTQTETNYLFQNSFRNPSLKHYLISEARLTHAMKARDADIGHDFEYDSNDDFDDVLEDSDLSCDADDEYDCDYTDDEDDSEDDVDGIGRYSSNRRHDGDDSTEDELRRIARNDDRYDDPSVKSRERQKINSLFAPPQTSPTGSQSVPSGQSSAPTKSHSLTQISSNLSRNNSSVNQTTGKRLTAQMTTTSTTPTALMRPQTPPHSRQISQNLSLVPTTTSTTGRPQKSDKESQKTSLLSIESFAKENIERHRKRGIFIGKKVSLKSMLEWSKKSIRKPMISSISDQKLRHESKVMFKFVQKFMRDLTSETTTTAADRQLASSDDTDIAVYLLTVATQQPILRDELLVQIARQTTNNPNPDSELRGLRLMCACFWYFPPSAKLAPHLEAWVSSHLNPFSAVVKRKFEQQLRRSLSSHVVYVRKPHDREEVSRVLRCVDLGHVGVFGETLSDALIDGRLIPWPIVSLTEALLRCHGDDQDDCCEREGVFRCVGDLDEVTRLKIKMDTMTSRDCLSVHSDDIHVIASALKLYFRELKDPLIPFDNYSEATESAHDFRRALLLVERLPKVNRLALSYLIRFLQVFSAPEHVTHTKMDDANLSMVWAPNVLRSRDAHDVTMISNIFERTRAEMSFVRTLIQQMDTQFMAGVQ